jgi:hypothetical protein
MPTKGHVSSIFTIDILAANIRIVPITTQTEVMAVAVAAVGAGCPVKASSNCLLCSTSVGATR